MLEQMFYSISQKTDLKKNLYIDGVIETQFLKSKKLGNGFIFIGVRRRLGRGLIHSDQT
jgi:hypothetical protein